MHRPLSRVLAFIQNLARPGDDATVSASAGQTGLARARRLLANFVEEVCVRQDPLSERYGFTLRSATLGFRFLAVNGAQGSQAPLRYVPVLASLP